jgi:hypothetical protein
MISSVPALAGDLDGVLELPVLLTQNEMAKPWRKHPTSAQHERKGTANKPHRRTGSILAVEINSTAVDNHPPQ